jgi:hypothetical protein
MILNVIMTTVVVAAQAAILVTYVRIASRMWSEAKRPSFQALRKLASISSAIWLGVGLVLLLFVRAAGEPGNASLSSRLFNASLWLPVFTTCIWYIGIFLLFGGLLVLAFIPALPKYGYGSMTFWVTMMAIFGYAYMFGVGALDVLTVSYSVQAICWVGMAAALLVLLVRTIVFIRAGYFRRKRADSSVIHLLGVPVAWSCAGASIAFTGLVLGSVIGASQPYWTGDVILPYRYDVPNTLIALIVGSVVGVFIGLLVAILVTRGREHVLAVNMQLH